MLIFPEEILAGRDLLQPNDFYLDSHRKIYVAMVTLSARRGAASLVNLVTVIQSMEAAGTLESVGGPEYIASLDEGFPTTGTVRTYALKLRMLAQRRDLIRGFDAALAAAQRSEDPEEAIARVEVAIANARANSSEQLISASEAVDMVNTSLDPDNSVKPLRTGLTGLDIKTQGGVRPGELWIVGALPSRGKSSVARQIASNVVAAGTASLIFSLEMTVEQWFGADQANKAGVEVWRLRDPNCMNSSTRTAVRAMGEQMRDSPIWFDDSSETHVDKIVAKSRVAIMKYGVRLVVVDYAQRVTGAGREMRDQLGDVAKKLANFAKDNKVAVLLLSQLKRPPDINSKPSFEDLKESSYLGAHADTVLLNFRPVERSDESFTRLDQIIVAKQRHGPIGSIPVRFNGDILLFDGREWTDEESNSSKGWKAW